MGRVRTEQLIKSKIHEQFSGIQHTRKQKAWTGTGITGESPTEGLTIPYIWVRVGSPDATPTKAVNMRVSRKYVDVPVWVGKDKESGNYEVLGTHSDLAMTRGEWAGHINQPERVAEGLYDERVYPERLTNLRMYPDSGLTLGVEGGYYLDNTDTPVEFGGGTIDLTAHVPGTVNEKRIVLIGITYSTNTLTASAVTAVSQYNTPRTGKLFSRADIIGARNAAASTAYWIGAIPLIYGQTNLLNLAQYTAFAPLGLHTSSLYLAKAGGTMTGNLTLDDGVNIVTGTTTGTMIGTVTSQKIGFLGATPVAQQPAPTSSLTTITHTGPSSADYAIAAPVDSGVGSTWGFSTQGEFETVLSVVRNLQQEVADLKAIIAAFGLSA